MKLSLDAAQYTAIKIPLIVRPRINNVIDAACWTRFKNNSSIGVFMYPKYPKYPKESEMVVSNAASVNKTVKAGREKTASKLM
jgi:hypothetical protein